MGSPYKITVDGLDELSFKLKKRATMEDVKRVVRVNGDRLNERMKRFATKTEAGGVFAKGYSEDNTRDTIDTVIKDDGLTAEVAATTKHAEYVEKGTRFMEAEPFAKPALEEQGQEFLSDLQRLME